MILCAISTSRPSIFSTTVQLASSVSVISLVSSIERGLITHTSIPATDFFVVLNRDAVQDAIGNARHNGVKNARFFAADATRWIGEAAAAGEKADVIFMDPPREGSTPEFLASVARMAPKRVVYVSCNPVTLARDLATLTKLGYKAEGFTPVDMFPHTEHVEAIVSLRREI